MGILNASQNALSKNTLFTGSILTRFDSVLKILGPALFFLRTTFVGDEPGSELLD